ncbi:MAG: hypothetical protein N4A33_10525 [Bacteriovoracaceae bacterium]|jgi:hypothetical protein|nr:hypothetical protein [Bacteriovoracaceae bacterium]
MITHEDNLKFFIPKKKVKFVILGTMVAINARIIDGKAPKEDVFYYNNNRNHFWRVLQHLLDPKKEVKKRLTIKEKKDFLEKHGIAICNLVQKVIVPNKYKLDPSDTVLFEAFNKNRIEFKKIPPRVKKILKASPLFFTCRRKKGIDNLLGGFLETNSLNQAIKDQVWYLATPTRCNPEARAKLWEKEMIAFTL